MNAPRETFELTLTRFLRAPREKVYDAFVTPSQLGAWSCPRGMRVEAQADARIGGAYRLHMRARDGSMHVAFGQYVELARPSRLAYTWAWEGGMGIPEGVHTLVEVDLVARDGGTELRMRHSGFPVAAAVESHQHGWNSCLNQLSDLLDPQGTAGTLTLLGDARSTYTRTARMGFAEKGVAVTFKIAAPHSPEVLAVHPFGRIPALLDGPTPLWETSAILRFVDESFGDALLLTPGRIADRVACEQWVSAVNGYLYDTMIRRYVLQVFFPRGEGGQPDRGVIDRALAEMPAQLGALERAYERSDFVAGAALSHADLFIAPILAYLYALPESQRLLSDMPNIRRAFAAMQQRPSFKATDPQAT